jgi:hypothetical protein
MEILIENGYKTFTDINGKPLDNGYIFIGDYGLSPISNPKQAYWDKDLIIPATNIRTSGGYPVYNGSPGRLYTDGSYSILVQDKNLQTMYTQLYAYEEDEYYGEPIDTDAGDILFLDGSSSLSTSKGTKPINATAEYVESQEQSGNELVDNSDVKWPGKRGAWSFTDSNLTYIIELTNSGFTIDLRAKYVTDSILFALSNGTDDTNKIEFSAVSGNLRLSTETVDTDMSALIVGWNHVKLVAQNDFTLDVYLNGLLEEEGLSFGAADYTTLTHLSIGNNTVYDSGTPWTGYITDFRYAPYIDESLDHYDDDIPWRDPDAIYGENGIYKLNAKTGVLAYNTL